MNYVAKENDLEFDKDVNYFKISKAQEFRENLLQYPNQTFIGVIFCNTEWRYSDDINIPCKFETKTNQKLVFYNLVYNETHALNSPLGGDYKIVFPKDHTAIQLKLSVDNGILKYFHGSNREDYAKMDIKIQDFPKIAFRFWVGSDLVSTLGAFQFFIPYIIHFIATALEIIRERHKKLRQGLSVMGMSSGVYWTSWFITFSIINLLITIIVVFSGSMFRYKFFTDTPLLITFMMFFLFGEAMQILSCCLTTICTTFEAGHTAVYGFLLISIVLEYFINNPWICFLIYMENPPAWVFLLRLFLLFMPAFNYSIIFGGIVLKSGGHFDLEIKSWVQGPGFKFSDLWASQSTSLFGVFCNVPPVWCFFLGLIFNIIFYSLIGCYFDSLFYQNKNLFKEISKYFRKNKPGIYGQLHENSVEWDSSRNKGRSGIKIIGLDKCYTSVTCWRAKRQIHAVKNLNLEVNDGELLGILGHNGAGTFSIEV